ncbi:MAG TPA: hypothetical protein VHA73_08805 [Acidimicrobiales bacterium]|jgi:hypothetical protein|nr:hypothetical protein [Acidimicrobiales bacterium]
MAVIRSEYPDYPETDFTTEQLNEMFRDELGDEEYERIFGDAESASLHDVRRPR